MAFDKQAAERELKEMLGMLYKPRSALDLFRKQGDRDTDRVKRCERLLKASYSRIREFCAKHNMELPPDVPEEGAE